MFSKNDITPLRIKLSKYYNNYFTIISEKTELSRPTISKFFNNKKIKPTNALKIVNACIDLLQEKERNISLIQEKIKDVT